MSGQGVSSRGLGRPHKQGRRNSQDSCDSNEADTGDVKRQRTSQEEVGSGRKDKGQPQQAQRGGWGCGCGEVGGVLLVTPELEKEAEKDNVVLVEDQGSITAGGQGSVTAGVQEEAMFADVGSEEMEVGNDVVYCDPDITPELADQTDMITQSSGNRYDNEDPLGESKGHGRHDPLGESKGHGRQDPLGESKGHGHQGEESTTLAEEEGSDVKDVVTSAPHTRGSTKTLDLAPLVLPIREDHTPTPLATEGDHTPTSCVAGGDPTSHVAEGDHTPISRVAGGGGMEEEGGHTPTSCAPEGDHTPTSCGTSAAQLMIGSVSGILKHVSQFDTPSSTRASASRRVQFANEPAYQEPSAGGQRTPKQGSDNWVGVAL